MRVVRFDTSGVEENICSNCSEFHARTIANFYNERFDGRTYKVVGDEYELVKGANLSDKNIECIQIIQSLAGSERLDRI